MQYSVSAIKLRADFTVFIIINDVFSSYKFTFVLSPNNFNKIITIIIVIVTVIYSIYFIFMYFAFLFLIFY
jgi:hypothetical protein